MSVDELVQAPELPALHWADGGSPETTTEPDEGLKETGYDGVTDKPAAAHWNWREREMGRMAAWLAYSTVRRFDHLDDALKAGDAGVDATGTAVPVGAAFTVGPAATADHFVRSTIADLTADTPSYSATCCDGLRVFVAYVTGGAANKIKAYHRVANVWTLLWTYTPTHPVTCLCCDGVRVFAGLNTSAAANVLMIDAAAGTLTDSETLASSATATAIACNGAFLAVGAVDATNVTVKEYTYTSSALTYSASTTYGTVANSAEVNDLVVVPYYDGSTNAVIDAVVAAGDNGAAGADVICQIVAAGTVLQVIATGSQPASGVACDGRRIWLAHTAYEVVPASGITAYCQCRSMDGTLLWVGPSSASDAKQGIIWDGHRIYVPVGSPGAAADVRIFEPYGHSDGSYLVPEDTISAMEYLGGCDGENVIVIDRSGGATDTFLATIPLIMRPRRFVRTGDTDTNRLPGFALAQPAE